MAATSLCSSLATASRRANALFAHPRGDPAQERFRNRIANQRDCHLQPAGTKTMWIDAADS
ncbi:MAG TPA: hypothetical protein VIT21_00855 [Chthoniobacterales bacterium]